MLFMRRRSGPLRYVYLASLVILLVAVLVLHVSGTALVIFRIARIVLVVAILGIGSVMRRRSASADRATGGTSRSGLDRD